MEGIARTRFTPKQKAELWERFILHEKIKHRAPTALGKQCPRHGR